MVANVLYYTAGFPRGPGESPYGQTPLLFVAKVYAQGFIGPAFRKRRQIYIRHLSVSCLHKLGLQLLYRYA